MDIVAGEPVTPAAVEANNLRERVQALRGSHRDGNLDRNVRAKAQAAVGERRSPPVSAQLMQSLLSSRRDVNWVTRPAPHRRRAVARLRPGDRAAGPSGS